MDWNDIWKIVLGIVASVGGIGGIILAVIKFSSSIIAKRLEERYSLKLNKELEKYKSSLDNKIYISKTKFDTEFSIYRELSKAFFELVKNINGMIPYGYSKVPADETVRKEYEEKTYSKASSSVIIAQDTLNSNAPFISYDIFEKYHSILKLCNIQLNAFERRWDKLSLVSQEEKEKFSVDDYNRTGEINDNFKELNTNIREYLAKLDVLD